ncbi:hypothetical protein NKDENANG_03612 [Candidatus Entotheonellaceae bacterium PAL068K]
MLRQCVAAGGTDGAYAAQILSVDGASARTQRALVAMLREITVTIDGKQQKSYGTVCRQPDGSWKVVN